MKTKSQSFSDQVFRNVSKYINDTDNDLEKKRYKSLCKRSGGVMRTVGLIQFLTFLKAKAQKNTEVHHLVLLQHLQLELRHFNVIGAGDTDAMLKEIRQQSLPKYMHTTKEVLKLLQWHKRMADILIEGTADESGDN